MLVSIGRCVFSQLSVSECNQTLATEVMCSALQTDLRLFLGLKGNFYCLQIGRFNEGLSFTSDVSTKIHQKQ